MSLRRELEARVERHPDRLAVRFGELRQSFAELNVAIDRTAWALREQGARPERRVALILPNGPERV